MPRLAGLLATGGVLAVQMPRQQMAPSIALMRKIAAEMFSDRFDFSGWEPQVADPDFYVALLSPLGRLNLWESRFFQRLEPVADGHPVRHFTQSTAMRPFVEKLDEGESAAFVAAYDAALAEAYPLATDGAAMFPFQRLFFVLTVC
jgi:trans-aconitate 2-methyltransferase